MFKPGQSGNPSGKPKRSNGKPGAGHTLKALVRLRREPVAELIKIADATEDQTLKISLWKYLLERRDAGLELAGSLVLEDAKADLKALEAQPAGPVAAQAR